MTDSRNAEIARSICLGLGLQHDTKAHVDIAAALDEKDKLIDGLKEGYENQSREVARLRDALAKAAQPMGEGR